MIGRLFLSLALFFCLFPKIAFAALPTSRSISPSTGSVKPNIAITFTCSYSDSDGYADINSSFLLFNTNSTDLNPLAYIYYDQNTNLLYLKDDSGTAWTGGFTPGSANYIENSYLKLDCRISSVSHSKQTLTVKYNLTFKPAFSGKTYNTYLKVTDNTGNDSGWIKKGTYTVNMPPSIGSINPASGQFVTNTPVTFETTFIDQDGWQNIQIAELLINSSTKLTNCFFGYYDAAANKLYLRDNTNKAWIGGYTPGSSNIIENSLVSLDCSKTIVNYSDTILTVNWSITFKPSFLGEKNAYLYVKDNLNAYQNFTKTGSLTILSDTTPPIGSIIINNNNLYTNKTTVTLTLYAIDNSPGSGVSQMQFSNDNTSWSAPEPYTASKTWVLETGDGLKTVYAKFVDFSGNWSIPYQDMITLDTAKPALTLNPVITPTNNATQTLNGSKEANTSIRINGAEAVAINQETSWSYALSLNEGENSFSITSKDITDNESTPITCVIILDTTHPSKPLGFTGSPSESAINLSWAANPENDLAGYNIYRSTSSGANYTKINSLILTNTNYQDTNIQSGTTYYYVVTAIDNLGNESIYSGEVSINTINSLSENEPNNDFASANQLNINSTIKGTFNPALDQDYYKITLSKPEKLMFSLSNLPSNIDSHIFIYNSSQQVIANKYDGAFGENLYLPITLNNAGDYYIRVICESGNASVLQYNLSVNIAAIWFLSDSAAPNPFSPNSDSVNDTVNFKATMNTPCDWKIKIRDASGNVIRGINGKGSEINVNWNGKDSAGNILPDRIYGYNISLIDPQTGLPAFGIKRKIQIDTKIDSAVISNVSNGQTISGKFDIKGIVSDINYDYSATAIYYGKGTAPSEWTLLKQLYSPVKADISGNPQLIASWDTTNLSNGDYVIRLSIKDKAGNQKITEVPIKIYNVSIYNVFCSPKIISPNNDGVYDTTSISAALSLEANWKIDIKNASGSIIRAFSGTGSNITASWDGKDGPENTASDGTYSYEISATDPVTKAVFSQTQGSIQVDTKIDSAVISNITSGQIISGKIDIKGIADDTNFSSNAYTFPYYYSALYYGYGSSPSSWNIIGSYFTSPVKTDASGNAQILRTWDTTSLPSGNYVLRLLVNDSVGNQKVTDIPVTSENIAIYSYGCDPKIFSPNNDGYSDLTTISAKLTVSGNWQLDLKNSSGATVRSFSGTGSNISVSWNGRKESNDTVSDDGTYTYTINAQNSLNQPAKQVQGNIEIDTALPAVTFAAPLNGAEISGVTPIECRISDKNFLNALVTYGKGPAPTSWYFINASVITTTDGAKVSANWDTTNLFTLTNDNYTLRLTATDTAGNSKTADINVNLYNNHIRSHYAFPQYFSPNGDNYFDKCTIIASFNIINNWEVNITDISGLKIPAFSGESSNINLVWDGKYESGNTVSDGIYTYTITGTDPATGKSPAQVHGNIIVDNTMPTAVITNPASGASLNGTIAIKGTAFDTNFLSVYLGYGKGASPASWNYLYYSAAEQTEPDQFTNWDTTSIANGTYILRLIVTDWANNKKTIDLPVTIENAEPDITELSISPNPFTPDGIDADITNDITNISFKLSSAGYILAAIYDKNNILTKTLCANTLYPDPAKNMKTEFTWNGKSNNGTLARNGEYKVVVSTGSGAKQQYASVIINDMPIFKNTNVSPESFSPNGDNVFDTTTFSFSLSEDSVIEAGIYNLQNGLVKTITSNTSVAAENINKYTWDGKDLNGQPCLPGQYIIKVNATAVTGSIALPLNLNTYILPISNIRISSDTFDPYLNQTLQIFYHLDYAAKLSIKIYDANSSLIRNLISNEPRSIGEHSESWDGRDNSGNIPSDNYYYFTIEDSSSGITEMLYNPQNTGGQDISHSINVTTPDFDTINNQPGIITYTLPKPAKVNIKLRNDRYSGPAVRVIKYQEPAGAGQHQAFWDGRDEAGNIVSQNEYTVAVWGYTLPDNAILITGGKPVVSNVSISPISFHPYPNPYAKIEQESTIIAFNLSKDSYVTIDIYNSENILVYKLMDNVLKSNGEISLAWNGMNNNNGFLPSGYYRVEIQAFISGNYSDVMTAHTEVVY